MKLTLAIACLLGFTTAQSNDLPTCISDLEALIPDAEKIIADFKAGNYEQALTDALALEPEAQKAFTDCTASAAPHIVHRLHKFKKLLLKINVGDLPTCIADLEAMIPDVEKVIADFKAGNYEQALTDALALEPEATKAFTDCTASAKAVKDRFKTILKDDPRREYYEKQGAEFASGWFAGAGVERFDPIDFYNCLHREPEAVKYFYTADETIKYALIKHDSREAVKGLDEMIGYLIEMIKEDYPHTRREVCTEFQNKEINWGDFKLILENLKDKDRTLRVNSDQHWFFNHHDITEEVKSWGEDYVHQEFGKLGYQYGKTLLEASRHGPHQEKEALFFGW